MITIYSGLPGSGKSYEVVTEVIYKELKSGRTVVGNIDIDLVAMDLPDADYRRVSFDSASYWPVYRDGTVLSSGQLPRGALVVIDEAWQVLGTGRAQPALLDFLPVHRHFSDDKGSVNFAIVVQSPSLLDKRVLAMTDSLFVMHNKMALGMSKHYSVVIYGGHRAIKAQEISTLVRRYSKDRFAWYKSADASSLHRKTDSRVSYFGSSALMVAGLAAFALGFGIWGTYRYFSPKKEVPVDIASTAKSTQIANNSTAPVQIGTTLATKGYNLFSIEVNRDTFNNDGQSRVYLYNMSSAAIEPPRRNNVGNGAAPGSSDTSGPFSGPNPDSKLGSSISSQVPGGLFTTPGGPTPDIRNRDSGLSGAKPAVSWVSPR